MSLPRKMIERQYEIPCILDPQDICVSNCPLYNVCAEIFESTMRHFRMSPAQTRLKLCEELDFDDYDEVWSKIAQELRMRDWLNDCNYSKQNS